MPLHIVRFRPSIGDLDPIGRVSEYLKIPKHIAEKLFVTKVGAIYYTRDIEEANHEAEIIHSLGLKPEIQYMPDTKARRHLRERNENVIGLMKYHDKEEIWKVAAHCAAKNIQGVGSMVLYNSIVKLYGRPKKWELGSIHPVLVWFLLQECYTLNYDALQKKG